MAASVTLVVALLCFHAVPTTCAPPQPQVLHVATPSSGGVDADGRGNATHPLASLAAAVAAAQVTGGSSAPTIVLHAGVHVLNTGVAVTFALSLVSAGDGSATVACANGAASAGLDISGGASVVVVFTNLTFSNCAGSALRVSDGANATAVGSLFVGNAGAANGGAVRVSDAHFRCTGCAFSNNSATNNGGGVHVTGASASVTLETCVFSGNAAVDAGGAVVLAGGAEGTVTDSHFGNNKAATGGALAANGGTLSVVSSAIVSNKATNGAGFFLSNGACLDMVAGLCSANRARTGGCAHVTTAANASFRGVAIDSNTVNDQGAGVWAIGSSALFDGVHASQNAVLGGSGGLFYGEESAVVARGCVIERNYASEKGAGFMLALNAHMQFSDSTCRWNNGVRDSGCAHVQRGSAALIDRVRVDYNYGRRSAINVWYTSTLHMSDSTCDGNAALLSYAACVYVSDSNGYFARVNFTNSWGVTWVSAVLCDGVAVAEISSSIVANNYRESALMLWDTAEARVTDTVFRNNTCSETAYGGGAIVAMDSTRLAVTRCMFDANQGRKSAGAGGAGGAVTVMTSAQATFSDSVFVGNVAQSGGGALNVRDNAAAHVTGCRFGNNVVLDGDLGTGGAILYAPAAGPSAMSINNSTFAANTASFGSDIYSADVARPLLFGANIAGCAFTEGASVTSPPVSISIAPSTRGPFSVASGGTLPPISVSAVDAYGRPVVPLSSRVLIIELSLRTPGAAVPATGAALQGNTEAAVLTPDVPFSDVRVFAPSGTYALVVGSGTPLYDRTVFLDAAPVTVTPCVWPMLEASVVVNGQTVLACQAFSEGSGSISVAVFAAVIPCAVVTAAVTLGVLYWRKKALMERNARKYEVEFRELTFISQIGRGSYSTVYLGSFRGSHVAIKTLCIKGVEVAPVKRTSAPGRADAFASSLVFEPMGEEEEPDGKGHGARVLGGRAQIPSDVFKPAVAGFMKEVRTMSALRHPNIVMLLAASVQYPELAIVVELMARGSLYDVYSNPQIGMDWRLRVSMATDAARGLAYLHASNPPIYHLDLKSLNLFVDEAMRVKVGDFGLAEFKRASGKLDVGRTGTLRWMAPEVLSGKSFEGDKADVYSFGIVLWELLCRRLPYAEGRHEHTRQDIIRLVKEDRMRPHVPPHCPEPWALLMAAAWGDDRAQRPSMSHVLSTLEDFDPVGWPVDEAVAALRARPMPPLDDGYASGSTEGGNMIREGGTGSSPHFETDARAPVRQGHLRIGVADGYEGHVRLPQSADRPGPRGADRDDQATS